MENTTNTVFNSFGSFMIIAQLINLLIIAAIVWVSSISGGKSRNGIMKEIKSFTVWQLNLPKLKER